MEGGPLLSQEFVDFAKDYVLFLHVTTRIEGRPDEDLLQRVGGRAFPTFAVLDEDGDVLAMQAGGMQVEQMRAMAEPAAKLRELEAKAASGDEAAAAELVLVRGEMGLMKHAEFLEAVKGKELDPERVAAAERKLRYRKIQETALGEALLALAKEGFRPGEDEAQQFWLPILQYAEYHEDAATFELALDGLREVFGDNPRAHDFFRQQEEKLARLKE